MSHNLISGCHKCKVQIFHFRGEENKTILPFYKKHQDCAKLNIGNVETIMDNIGVDQPWAQNNGYENDSLQQ